MNIQNAYNIWSEQYDTNHNKTRDLEHIAIKNILQNHKFNKIIELGCGTGKNTSFLANIANKVFAVDFSAEMLKRAKAKVVATNVEFLSADLLLPWNFVKDSKFDLAVFSLMLEHFENLNPIFQKLNSILNPNAYIYIYWRTTPI